jgi:hypothetical protein
MVNCRKVLTSIVLLSCCSFSITPNSMIFNDFPLVFDNSWRSYKSSAVEHYHVDSVVLVSGALGEYGKTVFFFEGNRPKIEGNYLNTINGYITQSKSMYTFDNDNYGYSTSKYIKNSKNGTWNISDSMKLRFNGSEFFKSMALYVWDSTGTMMEPRLMDVYRDINNRADSVILKVGGMVSGMHMTRTAKYTYFYDNQNRYILRTDTTTTDVTGASIVVPIAVTRHSFTYTSNAMTIVRKDSSNNGWLVKDSIYASLMNDSMLSSEEKYVWNDTTSKWVKLLRKVFTYNTDGTCSTETTYGKNADSGWTIISKTCFFYNNYSGPVLPSLDEDVSVIKVQPVDKRTVTRTSILMHKGKLSPGQVYTLTGRKSVVAVPLAQSAVLRFIRE